jgi:predicted DNA-binding transcriptional regulator YafY
MKSDRLLSVLLFLQARGRVTERELAERLEVSQRTVHRDMEALSAARVPLSAIRGSQGGWELEKGWRTQVPGLDEGELRALLMAQPRALGHSRLAQAAESALNLKTAVKRVKRPRVSGAWAFFWGRFWRRYRRAAFSIGRQKATAPRLPSHGSRPCEH